MRTLVLGGIRSGKSRWAEAVIAESAAQAAVSRIASHATVSYIATASVTAHDPAWELRIATHRERRPSGWRTVETSDIAGQLRSDPQTPALVDDLGNWLTTTLDRQGWDGGSVDAQVGDLVAAVRDFPSPLVLVSPEVGLAVVPATAAGRRFADELGALNQRLADCCEQVVLVIAGQPLWVKPGREQC